MDRQSQLRGMVFAGICLLVLNSSALAQALGSLNGAVRDPQGASVIGATLTLTNTATGATRTVNTGKDGIYQFPQLQPGTYDLKVESTGFKTILSPGIAITVNSAITLDLAFEVGAVTESVDVTASADSINRSDATIGNTFDQLQIRQLPIEGRNVVDLLSLQPGVVKTNVEDYDDQRSGAVNGARSDQSNVTLDGIDVNDQLSGYAFTSVVPVTLDSVQEFRVITSNANANQGRSAGAQVSLVTKTGSNEFHGSVYEFHRNTATTANSFFNNMVPVTATQPAIPRPKLIRNVFGFSVGGPILKDKLFFFANYEGLRDAAEDSIVRTVPTDPLRQGIVRYINTSHTIGDITPSELQDLDPLGIGANPLVLDYFNDYPLPNDTSVGDGLNTLGFRFNAPIHVNNNTYIARIDYQINANDSLFVRGTLGGNKSNSLPQFPGGPPRYTFLENPRGIAIGYTKVINDHITTVTRYGFTRQGGESNGSTNGPYIGFRGFSDLVPYTYTESANTPVNNITSDTSWVKGNHTIEFGANMRFIRFNYLSYYNSFSYARANASWLRGSANELKPDDVASSFSTAYRDSAVALLGLISDVIITYNYNQDGSTIPVGEPIGRRYAVDEYEFYVQDQWKIKPNLTLMAGVRYGLFSPPWETNGLQVAPTIPLGEWFNQRAANAAQGIPSYNSPDIQFNLAGAANNAPGYYPWDTNNFGPRVSLAWSPDVDKGFWSKITGGPGKMSIRGGFGTFYERVGSALANDFDFVGSTGLSTVVENPSGQYTVSTSPRFQGFGTVPPLPPAPPGGFPAQLPKDAFAITAAIDNAITTPVDYSVDFSISRELPWNLVFEAAYIGRFGRNRLAQSDLAAMVNLVDPESGADWYTSAGQLADYIAAQTPISAVPKIPYFENLWPDIGRAGRTSTQQAYYYASKLAPDWTTVLQYLDYYFPSKYGPFAFYDDQYSALSAWRSQENTNFNAGQFMLRKRFSNGVQFDFNYTVSKSIDLTSEAERTGSFGGAYGTGFILNAFKPGLNRAVSDYDVRQSINSNFLWQLPVGHGQAFLSDSPGWVDQILGGWQLAGIFRTTSGFPISTYNGRVWPTNWNISGWATATGDIRGETTRRGDGPNLFPNPELAIASFRNSRAGEAGTRNDLRGDGLFQLDMGLGKTFNLPWEGQTIQFRWEVFNVTNTARFDPQSLDLDVTNVLTFGRYTGTLSPPRVMQFGLRYQF